ncbi:hypothetical protein DDB_G0272712 [Dictyostelium discoideum AX4]|uniref:Uncharacterized protein n=1 Tax=Dictyostelium discoideum TaxID=44689 RepID=Q86II8_DICDI|nr:hypothetical protein DDB_G0272712 [Dictyostelium discoideum AX4]EAL70993.1 hypothetical protein DDB_G0272712 [Dictyostelium discoideum AX4]|eukprot:XP_644867.1 hypothetical protein DDB_G0272712 [Dictyostelium discoideum AX4]
MYGRIHQDTIEEMRIINDNPDSVPSDWNWVSKHNFRANFIITGGKSYQEDLWSQFQLISKQQNYTTQSLSSSSSSSLVGY